MLPVNASPAPRVNRLLLAPEIFSSEGGIPRILQLYLRVLGEHAREADEVRLISLNDARFKSQNLSAATPRPLTEACACNRNKLKFVWATFIFGRKSNLIVCGHLAQLPVAWFVSFFKPGLRYDLVAHGIEIWRHYGPLKRLALRRVRYVYCVSEYTRNELLNRCPLPAARAIVLPNALDPLFPVTSGSPLPATPPVILLVSRLTHVDYGKGYADMIRAMPAVLARLPASRLRIIGRGNALADLQALVTSLGIQASVDFLGYADDQQMIAELRTCRLFALPSNKEGFGLVFIEAMSCGRPCLGARAGGAPEVITEQTGVLTEPGDIPGIAAAAIDALTRDWDEEAILERARTFTYPQFQKRLTGLL